VSGRADLASGPAGAAYLAGGFLGGPVLCRDGEEVARVELAHDDGDRARVLRLLGALDDARASLAEGELCVFLLGYEASAALDARAPRKARDATLGPDAWVRVYRRVDEASHDASDTVAPPAAPPLALTTPPGARAAHEARVARCREELFAGTLYQANLAHRVDVEPRDRAGSARWFLDRTREVEPAFSAWVDDAWGTLVSLSPEAFLRYDLREGRAAAYPIKGTRPRGATPEEDERLRAELQASAKDAAEHEMIVDLLRNDLGRVARPGGVTVTELMRVVTVPNVFHLETEIVAQLRPATTLGRLLVNTAPGGSITGAPKSAALDVIAALEAGPRGPYTGTLGVVDASGRGAASILIRTWLRAHDGRGALHVGGGIVTDSDPAEEWQETLDKAAAFGVVAERD
jgi:anthranilate/para-aminobenzoate synthase component I